MSSTDTAAGRLAPPEAEGLFIRKSSGLVREIGVRDSIGVALGVLVLVALFSGVAIFMGLFPNSDMYIPILVGAVISLLLGLSYSQLVGTFPRSGGEYIYTSRVFWPVAGAAVGGAALVAGFVNDGTTIVQSVQIYVPFVFSTLGQTLNIEAFETFAAGALVDKTGWIIESFIFVAIYVAVASRPISTVVRVIFWCFAGGFLCFLIISVVLLFKTHSGFVNDFNAASGPGAYEAVIAKAEAEGFQPGISVGDVAAMIPIGALIFSGFTFGSYAAGEIKRPLRTYKIAVLSALTIALSAVLLAWVALRHTVGLDFMQASASLATSNPEAYAEITPVPQVQGGMAYGLLAAGDPFTGVLIAIGALGAILANGIATFVLISRVVFALSFDRLLPTRMADVGERSHAPIYAIALMAVGVLTFAILGNATTLTSIFRNLILIAYAIFAIGSICLVALPFRRPDLFDAAPKVFRGSVLGIPVMSIIGALAAIGFIALDYVLATKSAYTGGYSTSSIITLAAVATVGILLYVVSRISAWRRGIDISFAMRELPPE